MPQMFFIADLIVCSTCFRHHYAHHQELESIIQLVAACGLWCLVFELLVWCGAEGYVSGLRAAAGVELRYLVSGLWAAAALGILFPHMQHYSLCGWWV
jgi:dihydrodipicolinate synthase/N-acetylneuraminate lyase